MKPDPVLAGRIIGVWAQLGPAPAFSALLVALFLGMKQVNVFGGVRLGDDPVTAAHLSLEG